MWMSARQSCQKTAEHTTWDLTVPHLLVPGLSPAAFQNSLVLLKEEEEKEEAELPPCWEVRRLRRCPVSRPCPQKNKSPSSDTPSARPAGLPAPPSEVWAFAFLSPAPSC